MSLCPNNDIHSVYLDGELPEQFVAEYEAHINNCPTCKAKVEKLKALRSSFANDSASITPDSHYVETSFDRLQVKMSYSRNTAHHKADFNPKNFKFVAMAAAAVVAFAFIVPVRISVDKKSAAQVAVASQTVPSAVQSYGTSVNNVSLNSGRSVVISGNIGGAVLPSVSSEDKEHYGYNHVGYGHHKYDGYKAPQNTGSVTYMKNVEMFRPNFEEPATISIRITFPDMGNGPIQRDLPLPENVITGNFE